MTVKVRLYEDVVVYYRTPIYEIKSEDYSDFKGTTEKEFLEFLKDNLNDIEEYDSMVDNLDEYEYSSSKGREFYLNEE